MLAVSMVSFSSMVGAINSSYVSRLLRVTLLAPNIVEAILDGRQPADMTLALLMQPFVVLWAEQSGGLGGALRGKLSDKHDLSAQTQPGRLRSSPTMRSQHEEPHENVHLIIRAEPLRDAHRRRAHRAGSRHQVRQAVRRGHGGEEYERVIALAELAPKAAKRMMKRGD